MKNVEVQAAPEKREMAFTKECACSQTPTKYCTWGVVALFLPCGRFSLWLLLEPELRMNRTSQ